MKNFPSLIWYLKAIVAVFLCVTVLQSNSQVVQDFVRKNLGKTKLDVPTTPTYFCDASKWTCNFTTPASASDRSVPNVAMAHINSDGSIYLQELSRDPSANVDDLWSTTLPVWYINQGKTTYALLGTDCIFTIKPVVNKGVVADWTFSVRGASTSSSTTVTSGSGKDAKSTTVTTVTNTCGGDEDQGATTGSSGNVKSKGGKDKGKGPGPK
jgi:hypothetical protein